MRKNVKLHPETVANAAAVAKQVKRKKPMRVTVRSSSPVLVVKADPRVMKTALELAGGDARRLQILPDGAVLVLNNPRTTKPQPNR